MFAFALPVPQITVPTFRLNSNLLSLISVILLCVMVFLAVDAIAQVCLSEQRTLNNAQIAHGATGVALVAAELGMSVALASLNPGAIAVAGIVLAGAILAHRATAGSLAQAYLEYYECLQREGGG